MYPFLVISDVIDLLMLYICKCKIVGAPVASGIQAKRRSSLIDYFK